MPRNLFTNDEITLCAYVALCGESEPFTTTRIAELSGRGESSVSMKISNFVAMLNFHGVATAHKSSGLSGTTTGIAPRKTNWDIVEPLTALSRQELRRRCVNILGV